MRFDVTCPSRQSTSTFAHTDWSRAIVSAQAKRKQRIISGERHEQRQAKGDRPRMTPEARQDDCRPLLVAPVLLRSSLCCRSSASPKIASRRRHPGRLSSRRNCHLTARACQTDRRLARSAIHFNSTSSACLSASHWHPRRTEPIQEHN